MPQQRTLKKDIKLIGLEPYGGNAINVKISPAEPNTGIIFTDGVKQVPLDDSKLDTGHRLALTKTLLLQGDNARVRGLEHLLGTFFAYGIDNAVVRLQIDPHFSYRLFHKLGAANKTLIVPYFPDLQRGVCRRIQEVGIEEQESEKAYLRLKEEIDAGKLRLKPIEGDDIVIQAKTKYTLSSGDVVEGSKTITLTPSEYEPIAHARAYLGVPTVVPKGFTRKTGFLHSFPTFAPKSLMRFLGNLLYLSYGFGNGIRENNSFYSPDISKKWKDLELMPNEIACHTIIDRAGDLLERLNISFNARPAGMKLTCEYAGHKDAHNFIRDCQTKYRSLFVES